MSEEVTETWKSRARELFWNRGSLFFAILLLGQAVFFVGVGWTWSKNVWPTPIDDSYIHAVYARNFVRGYLFTWSVPDGYSKGETSAVYPLLLAPGWVIGFRDHRIMAWAALINMVSAWLGCCLIYDMMKRHISAILSAAIGSMVLLCGPTVWGVFSGMEIGVALLGTSWILWSFDRLWHEPPTVRAVWIHIAAGSWLVAMRPDGALVYGCITIFAIVKHWRVLGWQILSLVFVPALPVLLYFLLNKVMTGSAEPNSAVIKSFWKIEYYSFDVKYAIWREQLVRLPQLVSSAWFGSRAVMGWNFLLLIGVGAMCTLASKQWRGLILGGGLALAVVYLFQAGQRDPAGGPTARYLSPWAPILFTIVGAVCASFESLIRTRFSSHAKLRAAFVPVAWILPLVLIYYMSFGIAFSHHHFLKDSRRIATYQIPIAREMRRLADAQPERTFRFMTHEGGAPIYFSDLPAIDILGLCSQIEGYPLQTAHIEDAMAPFEALESSWPREDLPDWTVMFTSLWGIPPYVDEKLYDPYDDGEAAFSMTERLALFRFPKELVGAGHPLPTRVSEAGWRVVDRLDIVDRVSENTHGFRMPPAGVTFLHEVATVYDTNEGGDVYDIGRGLRRPMSFKLSGLEPGKPLKLYARAMVRSDSEVSIEAGDMLSTTLVEGEQETKLSLLYETDACAAAVMDFKVWQEERPAIVIAHLWAIQPE